MFLCVTPKGKKKQILVNTDHIVSVQENNLNVTTIYLSDNSYEEIEEDTVYVLGMLGRAKCPTS